MMLEVKFLYESILIIYALSITGYFIDFIQHNRKANKIAFWLLGIVWLLQTVLLLQQILSEQGFPILTIYDGLFFYAWVLVTLSLIINRLFPVRFIVFFTNLFGFFIVLLYMSTNAPKQIQADGIQFVHEILIAHITLAIISYGVFTLSFIFSLMYLLEYHLLKKKRGIRWIFRFTDLTRLGKFAFRSITLGVPLLLIGLILGFVWAFTENVIFYWFDVKTLGSIVVLVVYIVYLILSFIPRYTLRSLAVFNTAAFLILLINFFLFGGLSNFHF